MPDLCAVCKRPLPDGGGLPFWHSMNRPVIQTCGGRCFDTLVDQRQNETRCDCDDCCYGDGHVGRPRYSNEDGEE